MINIIELKSMSFRYNKKSANIFTDLNLEIPAQKFICLWGPSGSGKSTLLSIIGGIIKPNSGELVFQEQTIVKKNNRAIPDNSSWVTQSANVFPSMTAQENATIAALAKGTPTSQAISLAKQSLTQLGIEEYAQVKARYLSGGQSQRVAIARAITARCPLILGDEPTGQLDR